MYFALEKVYCPKGCIEKEPSISSEHFTVGIFAMKKIREKRLFSSGEIQIFLSKR